MPRLACSYRFACLHSGWRFRDPGLQRKVSKRGADGLGSGLEHAVFSISMVLILHRFSSWPDEHVACQEEFIGDRELCEGLTRIFYQT